MNSIQVTPAQLILAVVGAASISGIITGVILALSQWRERIARQRELVLNKAVELAIKHAEIKVVSNTPGVPFIVIPTFVVARFFHGELKSLFGTGQLSPKTENEFKHILDRVPDELTRNKF